MLQSIQTDSEHYSELVARQVEQYKETEVMHDLPPIFDYWSVKHNTPKFATVIGENNLTTFYADYFQRCLEQTSSNFLISIGSGDSSIEIAIVKELIKKNVKNFFFICLELSPLLIDKARKKIDAEHLGDIITAAQIDINNWKPNYSFAAVMAHHSLHHILDLEQLFSIIKNNLAPNGRFLTADMIGRNGHMRWPEALVLMRKLWAKLPRKYKYHHQFKRYDDYFDNWDCSVEGFEGIRAQDILPLLVNTFYFETFYGYGNLTDVFIDRNFGPNFDIANPLDKQFIDYVETINEQLISEGILKPTAMIAVMGNEPISDTKIYKNLKPSFCIRDPQKPAPIYNPDDLVRDIYSNPVEEDNYPAVEKVDDYTLNCELKFNNQQSFPKNILPGHKYLTYGWSFPDEGCTWSACEDAALTMPLKQLSNTNLLLTINMHIYHSSLYKTTKVDIMIAGRLVKSLNYTNNPTEVVSTVTVQIPFSIVTDQKYIEIKFMMPDRRQPQYESGEDLRALGIGLISLKIS